MIYEILFIYSRQIFHLINEVTHIDWKEKLDLICLYQLILK